MVTGEFVKSVLLIVRNSPDIVLGGLTEAKTVEADGEGDVEVSKVDSYDVIAISERLEVNSDELRTLVNPKVSIKLDKESSTDENEGGGSVDIVCEVDGMPLLTMLEEAREEIMVDKLPIFKVDNEGTMEVLVSDGDK